MAAALRREFIRQSTKHVPKCLTMICQPGTILSSACDERPNFSNLESVKFDEVTEERLAKSVQKTDGAMTPRQVRPVMGLGRHCTIETPSAAMAGNPARKG